MTLMPKLSSSMEATMSKIGRVNLELQEQANELGYDTVQEALDNGYEVIQRTMGAPRDLDEIDREPEVWYELQKKDELEEAHKAWLKEKKEVLGLLDKLAAAVKGAYDSDELFNPETAAISFDDGTTKISYKDITRIKEFVEKGEE